MQGRQSAHQQSEAAAQALDYRRTAQYYDSVYAELAPADIDFYTELAAACGGPVLELGCGTGRVSLPLARAGHSVTALDISPHMLDVLTARLALEDTAVAERIELVQASMADFSLGGGYALIICPFRSFQHLLSTEEQRRCLELVHEQLAPDGRFVFDAFNPSPQFMAEKMRQGRVWQMDYEGSFNAGGLLCRYVMLDYDLQRQLLDLRMRFEESDSEGELLRTVTERLALRWLYRYEAQYLLELCGFEIAESYGAYDRRPLEEGRELIYVCRRTGKHAVAGESR